MSARVLACAALVALVACGGDPFVSADLRVDAGDDLVDDAAGDVHQVDAGDEVLEAAAGDVSMGGDAIATTDSPTAADVAAGPDAEAGPACCEQPTAACSLPLASCPIASENHGTWPTSFELYATPAENCMTTATPAACLCDYTCSCIAAHFTCPGGTFSCSADPVQGIVVTCAS